MYIILRVLLPRNSWGLYGELSFFLSGAAVLWTNILWSTTPNLKIHQQSGIAQIKCLHTVSPMKMLYRHGMIWRQMHRPSHISKALGRMLFCCNAKFQHLHGSWFLIVLELCLSATGMSSSTWSPSSVESGLVDLVNPWSTSSCCFDGELGMPSSWLSVRKLTGNASSTCSTGVDSLLPPPQHFYLLPVPGYCWWATGNFCVGNSCTIPFQWDIPHILVSLDRAAVPPHTPCSPTCSGFYVCPWRQQYGPEPCLSSSMTLPCYVYYNNAYGTMLPSAETGPPSYGPT